MHQLVEILPDTFWTSSGKLSDVASALATGCAAGGYCALGGDRKLCYHMYLKDLVHQRTCSNFLCGGSLDWSLSVACGVLNPPCSLRGLVLVE